MIIIQSNLNKQDLMSTDFLRLTSFQNLFNVYLAYNSGEDYCKVTKKTPSFLTSPEPHNLNKIKWR